MKNSFVLYTEYKEHIDLLDTQGKADLLDAIFEYAEGNDVQLEGMALMAFSFIKSRMDKDNEKYAEICEKRKESGSKGGQAKATKAKQEEANASKGKQMLANASKPKQEVANVADNDNEYDNDNDIKNTPLISPLEDQKAMIAEKGFSEKITEYVNQWLEYKKERREGYKGRGFKSFLTEVKNNIDMYGEDAVIEVILSSMSANYKGIVWDRLKRLPRGMPSPEYIDTGQQKRMPQ